MPLSGANGRAHLFVQGVEGLPHGQVHVQHHHLAALGDELVGRVVVQKVRDLLARVLLQVWRAGLAASATHVWPLPPRELPTNTRARGVQAVGAPLLWPGAPPPRLLGWLLTGSLGLWMTMGATTAASALAMSTSGAAGAAGCTTLLVLALCGCPCCCCCCCCCCWLCACGWLRATTLLPALASAAAAKDCCAAACASRCCC